MQYKEIIQHGQLLDTYDYKAIIELQANTEFDRVELKQSKQKTKTKVLKKLPSKMGKK